MAEVKKVLVPDIGDFDAVDVVEVLVQPGDTIQPDDPLISLESDKATMDVPAPEGGVVAEVAVAAGDKVGKGDLILTLKPAAGEKPEPEAAKPEKAEKEKIPEREKAQEKAQAKTGEAAEDEGKAAEDEGEAAEAPPAARRPPLPVADADEEDDGEPARPSPAAVDEEGFARAYASPAVRRFARELGVDLARVEGSGRNGRILKEDVQNFVKRSLAPATTGAAAAAGAGIPPMPKIDFAKFGEIETRPLSRIRKAGAKNLHRAWLHVPHVTQHDEADVTALEEFRKAHAEEAKAKGFKLTLLAFLIRASVAALREFPEFNSSLGADGESLVLKKYFHIGIAVDTSDGLVVPVIRDADRKGLFELAAELAEVSGRAREGKLKLSDIEGASFSISSLGGIGGTAFTPIVNAPEVAILGVSRAAMKPVWQDGEFVPRLILPLSLSYDHRVIDGAMAARFTTFLGRVLGDIRRLLL